MAYVGSGNRNGRLGISLNYADNTIAGATTGNTDQRRLYFSSGLGQIDSQVQDRKSNYNSMQLALIKRYSNGFTVTSNYTLSKVEGDRQRVHSWHTMPQPQALLWSASIRPPSSLHDVVGGTFRGGILQGPMKWVIGGWQWTGDAVSGRVVRLPSQAAR